MPDGAGYVNQGNQPVLKVVPFDQLLARVEIPSTDIGFVRIGQPVDISIDSFPATDFGVLEGSVIKVGSDALEPEQLNQEHRYPAERTRQPAANAQKRADTASAGGHESHSEYQAAQRQLPATLTRKLSQ